MVRKRFISLKILLMLFVVGLIVLTIKYLPNIIKVTSSLDKFRDYVNSMEELGSVFFIIFQILQTAILPIPGEVIQVAGGYIYGVPLGLLYTVVGTILGSMIAFYFTRIIGSSFVEKLVKKKKAKWVTDMMDSKKFTITLSILFLIPGLPKDFFIYMAGLSPIKPIKFFTILLLTRLPWLLISVIVGANMRRGNYNSVIILALIASVLFLLGMINKNKIINKFSQYKAI